MIDLIFPDGSKRQYDDGVTGKAVAASIAPSLAKRAALIKLNGELFPLRVYREELLPPFFGGAANAPGNGMFRIALHGSSHRMLADMSLTEMDAIWNSIKKENPGA